MKFIFATTFTVIASTGILFGSEESLLEQLKNVIQEAQAKFPVTNWQGSALPPVWDLDSLKQLERSGIRLVPVLLDYSHSLAGTDTPEGYGLSSTNVTISVLYCGVTKTKGSPENDPWCGDSWGTYWYGGYELCQERFSLLYDKLQKAKELRTPRTVKLCLVGIRSMGVYALPFLMEKIDLEEEFMTIIQEMMYPNLQNKSVQEIKKWWEDNKLHYQLPPQNEEKLSECFAKILGVGGIAEKIERFYPNWKDRHIMDYSRSSSSSQLDGMQQYIDLGKLIGIENTPQFHFLVALGEEALSYLFLKLKEEEKRFTLPVIEKIMGKKLTDEEIEQHIKEAESLLNPSFPTPCRTQPSDTGPSCCRHFCTSARKNMFW